MRQGLVMEWTLLPEIIPFVCKNDPDISAPKTGPGGSLVAGLG